MMGRGRLDETRGITPAAYDEARAIASRARAALKELFKEVDVLLTFSAPGAEGCGGVFSSVVDKLVDELLGVPAAAGHNTAILEGTLENATAEAVKKSE